VVLGGLVATAPLIAACAPAAAPSPAPAAASPTPLPPPEVAVVRFAGAGAAGAPPTCDAQLWVVEETLREEGIQAKFGGGLRDGTADFVTVYANFQITGIDAGFPLLVLAGGHTGCIEMWAAPGIRSISDLRGKTYQAFDRVAKFGDRAAAGIFYGFLLSTLAHIGLDPAEMKIVDVPGDHDVERDYREGRSDVITLAVAAGPLMRRNPSRRGSVILDTSVDKPWSQNYCCLLATHRDFAKANPVTVKRVTRAFVRAGDLVASDKKAAVRTGLSRFYKDSKVLTAEVLDETIAMLSYDWREFDPEETVRFFALRLRDAKLVKKSPQQILDEGSDLAYFRQLRKELKA
jgi:NitT/TauT family transport system substrate-binding protein